MAERSAKTPFAKILTTMDEVSEMRVAFRDLIRIVDALRARVESLEAAVKSRNVKRR